MSGRQHTCANNSLCYGLLPTSHVVCVLCVHVRVRVRCSGVTNTIWGYLRLLGAVGISVSRSSSNYRRLRTNAYITTVRTKSFVYKQVYIWPRHRHKYSNKTHIDVGLLDFLGYKLAALYFHFQNSTLCSRHFQMSDISIYHLNPTTVV